MATFFIWFIFFLTYLSLFLCFEIQSFYFFIPFVICFAVDLYFGFKNYCCGCCCTQKIETPLINKKKISSDKLQSVDNSLIESEKLLKEGIANEQQ